MTEIEALKSLLRTYHSRLGKSILLQTNSDLLIFTDFATDKFTEAVVLFRHYAAYQI